MTSSAPRAIETVVAMDDDAAALVVSHGDAIEPALVACLPHADHGQWGALLGHCDGARLGFADGCFVGIRFRRAPRMPAACAPGLPSSTQPVQ